jgi:hypothetical protein
VKVARRLAAAGLFLLLVGHRSGSSLFAVAAKAENKPLSLRSPALDRSRAEGYPPAAWPKDLVKLAVFQKINEDRLRMSLPPVAWDEAVSRVGDQFCAQQIFEKTRGHFLMDGIPPYARTAFAGVFGCGSENSVSWMTTASSFSEPTIGLALSGQADMMGEKPPRDGHRKTILDPEATHVGVGYAIERGRFQMAEEFLARRLERVSFTVSEGARPVAAFEGKPRPNQILRFVTIAREPAPRPLLRDEANARTSYAYPRPFLSYVPEGNLYLRVSDTENQDRLQLHRDGSFSFSYSPSRPGLYTFVFYTSEREASDPRPGGSATLWFE